MKKRLAQLVDRYDAISPDAPIDRLREWAAMARHEMEKAVATFDQLEADLESIGNTVEKAMRA